MSTIKRYKITWIAHVDNPTLTVEIDPAICTDKLLHEINNFFINAEDRYLDSDCDITATVLKMLTAQCFYQQSGPNGNWNAHGLIEQFENGNIEGWPPMDGSAGIKIIDCDMLYINDEDMDIEEVSSCAAV